MFDTETSKEISKNIFEIRKTLEARLETIDDLRKRVVKLEIECEKHNTIKTAFTISLTINGFIFILIMIAILS